MGKKSNFVNLRLKLRVWRETFGEQLVKAERTGIFSYCSKKSEEMDNAKQLLLLEKEVNVRQKIQIQRLTLHITKHNQISLPMVYQERRHAWSGCLSTSEHVCREC